MYLHNKKFFNRLFLWGLFSLQLFLIVIFMIFGSSFNNNSNNDLDQLSVKFIGHELINVTESVDSDNEIIFSRIVPVTGNFHDIFHESNDKTLICFIEGTDHRTINNGTFLIENKTDNNCKCLPEWHGKDCGQPEVLWRAFMTSKVPIKLSLPRRQPHRVFYIIKATGSSIETLEIQIMELFDIVDLYILCDLSKKPNYPEDLFKQQMNTGFLKNIHMKILLIEDRTCTAKNIYKKMKFLIDRNSIRTDDILIYSQSDEILNRKAINYLKWYDDWPQPVRFRLKYTVFGFFWQHPESTILGSSVSQINVLEEIYKSDPNRVLSVKKTDIIIGDLNHFGGWYCRYCYQPIDIIRKLEYDSKNIKLDTKRIFLNNKQVIDSEYIQNLISNGLNIDGKMSLIKLHRFSDKYYLPQYVSNNSWKFDNIVINLFASWDDDYE